MYYFIGAVGFHIRAGDIRNLSRPLAFEAPSIVALVLLLVSL